MHNVAINLKEETKVEILRVENLTKVYGGNESEVRALDGVSFSVQ